MKECYEDNTFLNNTTCTCNAAMATLHPSGLPPYVDPCSPGLMVSITSSSAKTADTCHKFRMV